MQLDPILATMIDAAHAGGAQVRRYFRQELDVTTKSVASDIVTQADIASESAILDILRAAFPTAGIISEEAGVTESTANNEWFVIDPLDGTHNFSLGSPLVAVSIARMQPRGTVTHGVIYEPIVGATYAAAVGQGAWHVETGQRLSVSPRADRAGATVHYACSYRILEQGWDRTQATLRELRTVMARVTIHWTPATDLTFLARGATEGMISDHCEIHDVAAGLILVREAGGVVRNFHGQPATDTEQELILAGTPEMATSLQQVIETVLESEAK